MFHKSREGMAKDISDIMEQIYQCREAINVNMVQMDDVFKQCEESGISAQPLCFQEVDHINEPERMLTAKMNHYVGLVDLYHKLYGDLPPSLILSESEDASQHPRPL